MGNQQQHRNVGSRIMAKLLASQTTLTSMGKASSVLSTSFHSHYHNTGNQSYLTKSSLSVNGGNMIPWPFLPKDTELWNTEKYEILSKKYFYKTISCYSDRSQFDKEMYMAKQLLCFKHT